MAIQSLKVRDIKIIAVKFSKNSNQVSFQSVPMKIVFEGHEYVLAEQ